MNEISVFEHPEFGTVPCHMIDGEPWFVGREVALRLAYTNPNEAVRLHVPARHRRSEKIATTGAVPFQSQVLISEAGLYRLILRSNMPKAEEFTDWVTEELLPTVRKAQEVGIDVVESLKAQIEDLKQEVLMSEGEAATMRREVTKEGSVGYRLGYFAGRRSSHYDRAGYDPYKGGQTFKSPPKNR